MTKFAELSRVKQAIVSASAVVVALSVLMGAAAWAGDTIFWSEDQQKEYVQQVADSAKASEISKLKREIFKLQLEVDAGKATPEDSAYLQFLKQDLEELQQ